jgi:hypothetical protein
MAVQSFDCQKALEFTAGYVSCRDSRAWCILLWIAARRLESVCDFHRRHWLDRFSFRCILWLLEGFLRGLVTSDDRLWTFSRREGEVEYAV